MNKILIINPDKMDKIKLLDEFDNNIVATKEIPKRETFVSEKEYQELQRKSNEIYHEIVNEKDGVAVETCYLLGERDIKHCNLSFKSNNNTISKKLINTGIDYAFNSLGMETIFVNIEPNNQKLIKQLEELDFINLGEVKGKTTYLKEKDEIEIGSMKSEHNKKH